MTQAKRKPRPLRGMLRGHPCFRASPNPRREYRCILPLPSPLGFHTVNTNKDGDMGHACNPGSRHGGQTAGHAYNPSYGGDSRRIESSRPRKENKNLNGLGCRSIAECLPGIHEAPGLIYGSEGRGGEEGGGGAVHLHHCLLKAVADANDTSGSSKVSPQVPALLQNVISPPLGSEDRMGR